ncbi:MAG: hypothetical protein PVH41_06690 [Anaerolineae bacterium]|jgi:hypothetical protein
MYRSPTYAGQQTKSIFVEISERSAESARLVQQARQAEPQVLPMPRRFLARWAAALRTHKLERLGKTIRELRGEMAGQAMSAGTESG